MTSTKVFLQKTVMKIFVQEHVMKITNFERLKTLPLTEKEKKPCYKQKLCYIVLLKYIEKFEIMIIILENIEVLYNLYSIYDLKT